MNCYVFCYLLYNVMQRKEYTKLIDQNIQIFLDEKLAEYEQYGLPKRIMTMISYLKQNCKTGKRIRPYLVYLWYKAFWWKQDAETIRFSLGLELFHAFALVHDDLMDKGEMRHGEVTCHKYIETLIDTEDAEHLSQSQAILLGDLLFQWGQEVIHDHYDLDPLCLQKARENSKDIINETMLWQMMDIDFMARDIIASKEEILMKDRLKTAMYSLAKPMTTGILLAWASEQQVSYFLELWLYLGTAFQMRDDLRDIILSEAESGKTVFSDIAEGDQTIFTNYILEHWSESDKELLHSLWGKILSTEDKQKLQSMFERSGAIQYGKHEILENLSKAKILLDKAEGLDEEYKQWFYELVELIGN